MTDSLPDEGTLVPTPDMDWLPRAPEEVEVCRIPRLLHRFVMIDGPPRAGKSTLAKILSSFEAVELERIEEIYDYVGFLYSLGKIEKDAAVTLLRAFADTHIYNLYLSRNVNCRFGDHSSIFKTPSVLTYVKRMFSGEHKAVTDAILKDQPIMQQHAHFQMEHINIHFDAHPEALQVIEVLRHPVDLVVDFEKHGYGENVAESLVNVLLCLRNGETGVHMLARGWEDEYLALPPVDRVMKLLHGYQLRAFKTYQDLSPERKGRVHVAVFEDFLAQPAEGAERLASFMGTRTTPATRKMIARAGCPRRVVLTERERNHKRLNQECSSQSLRMLDEMIANYETRWAA